MDEHFAMALRIEQVAASVFLSTDRFTEVFGKSMGRTPRDYLRHLRLEQAKLLLATTDESISSVGLKSGFSDIAYFSRVFRAAVGLTPSRYRAGLR
jgi:transcriptional regulator GlxA family with amidase domain